MDLNYKTISLLAVVFFCLFVYPFWNISQSNNDWNDKNKQATNKLYQVAERGGGIGFRVRIIAEEQEKILNNIFLSLNLANKREGFLGFLAGKDWPQIQNAKSKVKEYQKNIDNLKAIKDYFLDEDQKKIEECINEMENILDNLNQTVQEQEKPRFSLFGWLM